MSVDFGPATTPPRPQIQNRTPTEQEMFDLELQRIDKERFNLPYDAVHLIDSSYLKFSCCQSYDASSRTLIITIPGRIHASAAQHFSFALHTSIVEANLEDETQSIGSGRMEGNMCYKEPDGSWIPPNPPPTDDIWPSVIVEVTHSESSRRLHLDASWWLANSQGEVKVVILIFVDQGRAKVTFESIINSQPIITPRNGQPRFQPVTRQKIEVSRPPGGSTMPVSCVPAEPLHVSSEELLRRVPVPPETDADIPVQSLIEVATMIWNIQRV
ncbi:hypothetical protein N7466_000647 [Penicillium verhagenii]|uniref:uncharacterized protein n=1 Tax=Penicillium verhagenii TaxID=1562060 RepID=UPI002545202E|nr:uncharacterized protein N7466_000647 [Penicillium verhagenii]KAJ5947632.1 hypothetical protein N7466_000647 [Penicillium verhagenii]